MHFIRFHSKGMTTKKKLNEKIILLIGIEFAGVGNLRISRWGKNDICIIYNIANIYIDEDQIVDPYQLEEAKFVQIFVPIKIIMLQKMNYALYGLIIYEC